MDTEVTLDRYAEMRAEMEAGSRRDEVLSRAGLTPEEWSIAQREWLGRMGRELERERFELTNRYTRAFVEHLSALTEAHVADKKTIPAPAASTHFAHVPPAAAEPAKREPDVADFEQHRADAPFARSGPLAAPTPAPALSPWARATVDDALAAPQRWHTPAAQPAPGAGSSSGDPTETIAFAGMVPEVTPFQKENPGAAPLPRASAPPQPTAQDESGGTLYFVGTPHEPALPFAAQGNNEPPRPADEDASQTMFLTDAPDGPTLPFAAPKQGTTDAARMRSSGPAPVMPRRSEEEAGETMFLSPLVAATIAALPFPEEAPPPPLPALSLEQYAALCADLSLFPEEREKTFSRYGLTDPGARKRIDESFRQLLARDPDSQKRWHRLYMHYREALSPRR